MSLGEGLPKKGTDMGYFVEITEAYATLPQANWDEAYKRLCELNDHDEWKRGGSFGGETREVWYSWMPTNYPAEATTARQILEMVGYEIEDAWAGDWKIVGYGNKTGCEDLFFWAISDLFFDGHIHWMGEDGERWRWEFGNGKKMTVHDLISYYDPNGEPFVPMNWNEIRGV